jgi:co-chaperonin GroES (HSP10)
MNPDRLASPANANRIVTIQAKAAKNTSGMVPVGTKVLVLPDEVSEKSVGGVFLPESTKETNDFAVCTGVLVAIGACSFTDWPHSDRKWPGTSPEAGNRVFIAKYAGVVIEGKDGKRYRLLQDTDIAGMEV